MRIYLFRLVAWRTHTLTSAIEASHGRREGTGKWFGAQMMGFKIKTIKRIGWVCATVCVNWAMPKRRKPGGGWQTTLSFLGELWSAWWCVCVCAFRSVLRWNCIDAIAVGNLLCTVILMRLRFVTMPLSILVHCVCDVRECERCTERRQPKKNRRAEINLSGETCSKLCETNDLIKSARGVNVRAAG